MKRKYRIKKFQREDVDIWLNTQYYSKIQCLRSANAHFPIYMGNH